MKLRDGRYFGTLWTRLMSTPKETDQVPYLQILHGVTATATSVPRWAVCCTHIAHDIDRRAALARAVSR